jgi:hypothetical protein
MFVEMVSSLRLLEERFALGLRLEAKKFVASRLKSLRSATSKRIRFASNLKPPTAEGFPPC